MSSIWPISFDAVLQARDRLSDHLSPTPVRDYPALDAAVGCGIGVRVKHENHNPTTAFKVRNAVSALSALPGDARRRGVVAATRGNHGAGLAWAGRALGVPVTICVPVGNNPEKNEAVRSLGAELVERGADYDDALGEADRLVRDRDLVMIHATNNVDVIAGAATITLEILEQAPEVEALVISVGGGSQAVGAMTVARELRPGLPVYGVQAAAAPTFYDSFHAGVRTVRPIEPTIADGLATRDVYEMTFDALREGLADCVTVTEEEIASAIRLLLRTTHNVAEGGGAAGLAGVIKLRETLAGKKVGIILSGGNIDGPTLRRVLS